MAVDTDNCQEEAANDGYCHSENGKLEGYEGAFAEDRDEFEVALKEVFFLHEHFMVFDKAEVSARVDRSRGVVFVELCHLGSPEIPFFENSFKLTIGDEFCDSFVDLVKEFFIIFINGDTVLERAYWVIDNFDSFYWAGVVEGDWVIEDDGI